MSCGWCGHAHCPHCGYAHCPYHGYDYEPPPWGSYGPGYGSRRRRRRVPDEDDLAAYLEDLEDEIAQVREELQRVRRARSSSGA
ncbi:MAG: hypothetical protein ACYCVZ_01815 [Streptosporangiaceae bacterium]